jgi:hypothetical protein
MLKPSTRSLFKTIDEDNIHVQLEHQYLEVVAFKLIYANHHEEKHFNIHLKDNLGRSSGHCNQGPNISHMRNQSKCLIIILSLSLLKTPRNKTSFNLSMEPSNLVLVLNTHLNVIGMC